MINRAPMGLRSYLGGWPASATWRPRAAAAAAAAAAANLHGVPGDTLLGRATARPEVRAAPRVQLFGQRALAYLARAAI